jgi:hypothetical protein
MEFEDQGCLTPPDQTEGGGVNRDEHLLVILAEECAEVAKETSKAIRFGMDEMMPGQPKTNRERVLAELQDLWAAVEMLGLQQVDRPAIERKKARVEEFMRYAEKCGTLT